MQKANDSETEDFNFFNVIITLKQGNILECPSDILVNPTDQYLSLQSKEELPSAIRKHAGKWEIKLL